MHAAFVADEIRGDSFEPARISTGRLRTMIAMQIFVVLYVCIRRIEVVVVVVVVVVVAVEYSSSSSRTTSSGCNIISSSSSSSSSSSRRANCGTMVVDAK